MAKAPRLEVAGVGVDSTGLVAVALGWLESVADKQQRVVHFLGCQAAAVEASKQFILRVGRDGFRYVGLLPVGGREDDIAMKFFQ